MKVVLVSGNERVEIDGDDELIERSLSYQGVFERKVTEVSKLFYAHKESSDVQ